MNLRHFKYENQSKISDWNYTICSLLFSHLAGHDIHFSLILDKYLYEIHIVAREKTSLRFESNSSKLLSKQPYEMRTRESSSQVRLFPTVGRERSSFTAGTGFVLTSIIMIWSSSLLQAGTTGCGKFAPIEVPINRTDPESQPLPEWHRWEEVSGVRLCKGSCWGTLTGYQKGEEAKRSP